MLSENQPDSAPTASAPATSPPVLSAPVRPGRPLHVAIAGFGVVGSAVARILTDPEAPHAGLFRITHVLNRRIAQKRVSWMPEGVLWTDDVDAVLGAQTAPPVDIFVELLGGLSPAADWVRRALASGKSVVTANKELIAAQGEELFAAARRHGARLAYGASVAGGVPVLSGLQEGLAGDALVKVSGILNGTCNYILTRMEAGGVSFEQALAEAQRAGFAEANPASDIEGYDARSKIVILSRTALGVRVEPAEVMCRSIRPVGAIDFHYARELGCTIRQISYAALQGGGLQISVQPMLVSRGLPHAAVVGAQNLVVSTGRFGGETTFSGNGAGGGPTAVAVVSDLIALARSGASSSPSPLPRTRRLPASSDIVLPHYTRFLVRDHPGILAAISRVIAEHGINIDAVLQLPGHAKSALPFAVTLEPCSQTLVESALMQLKRFDFLVEPPLCLPMMVKLV